MKFEIKIIKKPLINDAVVTKETKKSKANFELKEKLAYFFQYVTNMHLFRSGDVSNVKDERIHSYIDFLNSKKESVKKVEEKINIMTNERMDKALSDNEKKIIFTQGQAKIDKLEERVSNIDNKYEEAVAELKAREDASLMDGEIDKENELMKEIPTEEQPEIEPMEETIEPMEETIEPIEEQSEVEEEQLPPIDDMKEEITAQEQPVIQPMEEPISLVEKNEEIPVENLPEEEHPKIEEKKISPMEQFYNEYNEKINELEKNCKENFDKQISELVADMKAENDLAIKRETKEIADTAKEAISNANKNTERVTKEKEIIEQDRDQYKSHYEQTVEEVKSKNETLKSRDEEIANLKLEIDNKNKQLKDASAREKQLNETIEQQEKELNKKDLEITGLKNAVVRVSLISSKSVNVDSILNEDQSVEQTEMENNGKTL